MEPGNGGAAKVKDANPRITQNVSAPNARVTGDIIAFIIFVVSNYVSPYLLMRQKKLPDRKSRSRQQGQLYFKFTAFYLKSRLSLSG